MMVLLRMMTNVYHFVRLLASMEFVVPQIHAVVMTAMISRQTQRTSIIKILFLLFFKRKHPLKLNLIFFPAVFLNAMGVRMENASCQIYANVIGAIIGTLKPSNVFHFALVLV